MREQITTTGIVLSRTDFQEADRILTMLTPDHGKLRAIAKGVRRPRSKLAGGIELLSVSSITYLPGRSDLGTLISTRLITHYGAIVQDIQKTMLAYELLKRTNRATEDETGEEYYTLLMRSLEGLNDEAVSGEVVELWFGVQLLLITGHLPNLQTDTEGKKLDAAMHYVFEFDDMAFREAENGPFNANHIKLLRLAYATDSPRVLCQVKAVDAYISDVLKLVNNLVRQSIRT